MFKFSLPISASAEDIFGKAKNAITKSGGKVNGNQDAGSFSGHGIEGEYAINNGKINITINKKPFIIPENMIKAEVAKFFKG